VRYAHRIARLDKKVLFVQPSIFLINQTLSDLASLTPDVRFRAIHGENSDRVIADIIDHSKQTTRDGEILFMSKRQLETNERIKSRKHHGFDTGKLAPSSLFYLPCQAQNPANSFFIDHNAPGRLPIDPYVWAGYAANHHRLPEPVETVTPTVVQPKQEVVAATACPRLKRMRELLAEEEAAKAQTNWLQRQEAAIQRWRSTPAKGGNDAFLRLGRDLERAGINPVEIAATLWQEACHGRHPSERRAQIKYIMQSLRGSLSRMAA
jgi:hypothetical protein